MNPVFLRRRRRYLIYHTVQDILLVLEPSRRKSTHAAKLTLFLGLPCSVLLFRLLPHYSPSLSFRLRLYCLGKLFKTMASLGNHSNIGLIEMQLCISSRVYLGIIF